MKNRGRYYFEVDGVQQKYNADVPGGLFCFNSLLFVL